MKIYKQSRICVMLAYFVWSWSSYTGGATWWLLNVPAPHPRESPRNSRGAKAYCSSLRYLSEKQKQLCTNSPMILSKISEGVRVGIKECQYQFGNRRWNCTEYPGKAKVHAFEPVLRRKGPERAYVKAILSAAVSYTITKACSVGDLPNDCLCAKHPKKATLTEDEIEDPKVHFEWGGCSDDVKVGDKFSREFFDDQTLPLSQSDALDHHNNEVGRKVVRLSNKTTCKCHGLSGTCAQNICWRSLPTLRKVGDELLSRYDSAVKVRIKKSRVMRVSMEAEPTSEDLIYLKKSPTFCKENVKKLGSYGTVGRWCNATSEGTDGCGHMCCKRGYDTLRVSRIVDCNCKFQWCCQVKCQKCEEESDESYCR